MVGAAILAALGMASAQVVFTPSLDPVAGARLFEVKGCVACHAVNGVGGTSGPDIGRLERSRSAYEVVAAMWNHLPQMSGRIWATGADRPYLTPSEMSDLIAFLSVTDGGGGFDGTPGDAQRGRRLVTERGCLACHSLSGTGGAGAGSLDRLQRLVDSPWITMATMWNHAFLMEIKTETQNRSWPRLSAAEMTDLVAFLRAGRPEP